MRSIGELILHVEHVGCTAVPNLQAIPILDIDIVIPGCRDFVESVLAANSESHPAQDTACGV